MRAATTALIDQASAASSHADAVMAAIARLDGTPIRNTKPGPVIRTLITGMHNRGRAGQLTLCPHLSYDAPQPSYWCAWAPGRLRCAPCAHTAAARIRGTTEDRRCDHCRKHVPKIHADMAQLAPIVVDMPPGAPKCLPPITMIFGLCPACQKRDAR